MARRSRGHTPSHIIILASALLITTSCSGPQAEPLHPEDLTRAVEGRAVTSTRVLLEAMALHAAPPLGLELRDDVAPTDDAFWHAHAIAFAPEVRRARRAWLTAQRESAGAGAPGPIGSMHQIETLSPFDRQHQIAATVDLIGLLGIGPYAAEKDVAARVTGLAHGELEQSVWRASFEVDRARVRYAAAKRRDRRLDELATQARADQRRLELLFERGRLSIGLMGRVRAALAVFESQRHHLATQTVRAREALANAAGLPPTATALDAVAESLLDIDVSTTPEAPDGVALLDVLPSLRARRLAYALAEANLRSAVAAGWPRLRLGPQWKIRPDDLLTGGFIMLEVPWPSEVDAGIQAAVERRARAREAVEDALQRALTGASARREEVLIARDHRDGHAALALTESEGAWRSARARLSIAEELDAIETWLDALSLRSGGILDHVAADEAVLVSDLSLREASGRLPGINREVIR